jgi:hypothetical protein
MTTDEYERHTVAAWLRPELIVVVVVQRSKKERGARKKGEREGVRALKKSEKVERAADGRSEASFRSVTRLLQALQSVPLQANTQQVQTTQTQHCRRR